MPYCSHCGVKLPDNARFCHNCGIAVTLTLSNHQTHTINEGILHVCPSCGDRLNAFSSKCASCGYEIRSSQVSQSVQEFSHELSSSHSLHQKETILRSFPIPNTREDIFEFMILASTNLSDKQHPVIYNAWLVKFEQCYQKAQLVIKDPKDLTRIDLIYQKTQKTIRKIKRKLRSSEPSSIFSRLSSIIIKNAAIAIGIAFLIISIQIDRAHGNSSLHELIGVILLSVNASILNKRRASLFEILISAGHSKQ